MTTSIKEIKWKEEWKQKCKVELSIKSLKDYDNACNTYPYLPKEPNLLYSDFTNFDYELGFNNKRRR